MTWHYKSFLTLTLLNIGATVPNHRKRFIFRTVDQTATFTTFTDNR